MTTRILKNTAKVTLSVLAFAGLGIVVLNAAINLDFWSCASALVTFWIVDVLMTSLWLSR